MEIEKLYEQILEAENQAMLNNIKANTIVLNNDFAMCREFYIAINDKVIHYPPMIFGKHIVLGQLPDDYQFALTYVDEEKYETELDYYKKRCEALENKLEKLQDILEGN